MHPDETRAKEVAPPRRPWWSRWWGIALLLYLPLLFVRLVEAAGGVGGWWAHILGSLDEGDRVPGGSGGLVGLVGLAILVVVGALQSLVVLLVESISSIFTAGLQAIVIGWAVAAIIDWRTTSKDVQPGDPDYLRRWSGRGAALALLVSVWVLLLVPLLSQLGEHPTDFPTAGAAVSFHVWVTFVLALLFRVVGLVVRALASR